MLTFSTNPDVAEQQMNAIRSEEHTSELQSHA